VNLIALAGPTAAGKSEIALLLAEKLGGEIVSVDSMQVYRGLDIGTAKPSKEQRERIPHHLLDVAELTESFDAARFVELARAAISAVHQRGRMALLCGGTGLYFQAWFEGLGEAPPSNSALRAELEAVPLTELLRELDERDPATGKTIDRQNPRRVIRALEVIRLTGRPFSEQRAKWTEKKKEGEDEKRIIIFSRVSGDLHQRINARVDEMFRRGLVAETADLLKRGLERNRTASQALGYRQVIEHLQGDQGLAETIELVKIKTRQFARRQMTWFRKYGGGNVVRIENGEKAKAVVSKLQVLMAEWK
jgi:tRNA dimethylallyltransferase